MKVFISHSSEDKLFVRKLKKDLSLNYINTWIDEDEILLGDSLLDKLTNSIRSSTHFMIILSPNSVKSDWVKLELDNAFQYIEDETLVKIIPIHYRRCTVPKSLRELVNIDLTNETVYLRHGTLEFHGDKYYEYLRLLIRSITEGDRKLLPEDKRELTGEGIGDYSGSDEKITLHYRVVGYKSISKFLGNQISPKTLAEYKKKELQDFIPIVLPRQLEQFLGALQFGDTVHFLAKDGSIIEADFARFSTTNNRLAIPYDIRTKIGVTGIGTYKVIIHLKDKIIEIEK